jgi:hypothetical protein
MVGSVVVDRSFVCLIGLVWLFGWLGLVWFEWMVGSVIGLFVDWLGLVAWFVGWFFGWSIYFLVKCFG